MLSLCIFKQENYCSLFCFYTQFYVGEINDNPWNFESDFAIFFPINVYLLNSALLSAVHWISCAPATCVFCSLYPLEWKVEKLKAVCSHHKERAVHIHLRCHSLSQYCHRTVCKNNNHGDAVAPTVNARSSEFITPICSFQFGKRSHKGQWCVSCFVSLLQ